jgi:hypothetical protein
MRGMLVPETCWGNKTIYFVAFGWFVTFHSYKKVYALSIAFIVVNYVSLFKILRTEQKNFLSNAPQNLTEHCFFFFGRFPGFARLSGKRACRWRWVWSSDGMMLTGYNPSTRWTACFIATPSATNFPFEGLKLYWIIFKGLVRTAQ